MKVGDLAITKSGNLVVIAAVGTVNGVTGYAEWYDIIFSSTGNYRGGFPAMWLRKFQ